MWAALAPFGGGRHVADGLEHGVRAVRVGELPDPRDALLAALGYDVDGAEVAAAVGAVLVPRMRMIRSAPSRFAASTADSPIAPSPITVSVFGG